MDIDMKKLGLVALAAMAVHAAPVAAGSNFSWNFNDCGGSNFATCMSGTMSYNDATKQLTLTILNNGGPGVFTQVGLINVLPAGTVVTGVSAPTGWTWGATPLGGDGLGKTMPASKATVWGYDGPGGNGGFAPGQGGQFVFNVTNVSYLNLQNVGVGVHAQVGPNGCSTKFGIWNQGASTNDAVDGGGSYDPTCVSVPEPESMALLATGLFGLAFVAVRRRRNLIA